MHRIYCRTFWIQNKIDVSKYDSKCKINNTSRIWLICFFHIRRKFRRRIILIRTIYCKKNWLIRCMSIFVFNVVAHCEQISSLKLLIWFENQQRCFDRIYIRYRFVRICKFSTMNFDFFYFFWFSINRFCHKFIEKSTNNKIQKKFDERFDFFLNQNVFAFKNHSITNDFDIWIIRVQFICFVNDQKSNWWIKFKKIRLIRFFERINNFFLSSLIMFAWYVAIQRLTTKK